MPQEKPILQQIKGLFSFGEARPASLQRSRQAGAVAAPKSNPDFSLPMKLPAGTLQIIGLGNVRRSLGDRWDTAKAKAYRVVENTLTRRLTPADTYYRVDEESYLVLFTRLGRKEAEFKASVITREIESMLLGELDDTASITLASSIAEVDRALVLEKINSLDELLQYIRSTRQSSVDGEDVMFFADDGDAVTAQEAAKHHGPGPDMVDLDQSLTGLFQKKTSASFLKECEAGFCQSYGVKRQSPSLYEVIVIHRGSGLEAHMVNDPLLDDPEELSFYLDRYILVSGLLGLHRMISNGRNGIIVMRVSFRTMSTGKLRDIYLARLKEVPGGLSRHLAVCVSDIPDGTPASRLGDVMTYLTPYCKTRIISIRPDPGLVDLYAETSVHAFAASAPSGRENLPRLYKDLAHFVKRAAWHKRETILHGATSANDLDVAVTAGISFVSGPGVAPVLETPGLTTEQANLHLSQRSVAGAA